MEGRNLEMPMPFFLAGHLSKSDCMYYSASIVHAPFVNGAIWYYVVEWGKKDERRKRHEMWYNMSDKRGRPSIP